MRTLASVALLLSSSVALAQDAGERRRARGSDADLVREIERGPYVKSNVGATSYLNTHGESPDGFDLFSPVLSLGLGLGYDFIDRDRFSAAVELQVTQGLFQGPRDTAQLRQQTLTQGDAHKLAASVALEASGYVTRRLGIGVRAGGGVFFYPQLVSDEFWAGNDEASLQQQTANGQLPTLQTSTFVGVLGGPTIEYYTKLAHFSIGADVDILYVVGFDIGLYPSGYLKYTF